MATRFLQQGAELTSVYFIGSDFNQTEGTAIYRSHGTLSDEDDNIKVEQQVLQLRLWFNGFKLSHTGILFLVDLGKCFSANFFDGYFSRSMLASPKGRHPRT